MADIKSYKPKSSSIGSGQVLHKPYSFDKARLIVKKMKELEKEKHLQEAVIGLKKKYGKNIILKGMNLEEGATSISRNKQIGGHKA